MKTVKLSRLSLFALVFSVLFLAACEVDALPEEVLLATQGTFTCRTTVNGTSKDVIVVPDDATCRLNNTNVDGNIIVGSNATLIASGVVVKGNIQSEGHTRVIVRKSASRISRVNGDIQIKQGKSATVTQVRLGGSLQVEQNRGVFNLSNNTIGSDLQANQNTGTGLSINRNRIDGNLQCQSNAPAPKGSGNTASSKEDQCARL